MIYSIDLTTLNRMNSNKLLFGDGTCEICGTDDLTANVGGVNYCQICFLNHVENKSPKENETRSCKSLSDTELLLLHRLANAEESGTPIRLGDILHMELGETE